MWSFAVIYFKFWSLFVNTKKYFYRKKVRLETRCILFHAIIFVMYPDFTFNMWFISDLPVIRIERLEHSDGSMHFTAKIKSVPTAYHVQWKVRRNCDEKFSLIDVNEPEYIGTSNSLRCPVLVVNKKELLQTQCFHIKVDNFIGSSTEEIFGKNKNNHMLPRNLSLEFLITISRPFRKLFFYIYSYSLGEKIHHWNFTHKKTSILFIHVIFFQSKTSLDHSL